MTQPQEVITGRARVLDGDTIEVNGSVRVRFFGVDAPEYDQKMQLNGEEVACGQVAKQALKDRIAGQPVRVEVFDVDHYGRKCGVVYNSAGEDLNAWLCRNGYVLAFTKVTRRYVDLEKEAKAAKRGIWAGDFQVPADYRRQKRDDEAAGVRPPSQHRPPSQQQQQQQQHYQQQQQQQQPAHRPPQPAQQQQNAWGTAPPPPPPQQQQQQYQPPPPPAGEPTANGSGEGEAHWLVKLLGALLGACASSGNTKK